MFYILCIFLFISFENFFWVHPTLYIHPAAPKGGLVVHDLKYRILRKLPPPFVVCRGPPSIHPYVLHFCTQSGK